MTTSNTFLSLDSPAKTIFAGCAGLKGFPRFDFLRVNVQLCPGQ